jgi:hypothetical protein
MWSWRALRCGSVLLLLSAPHASAADKQLNIAPAIQQTLVWCWVAVSEMVFEHFGVENLNPAHNYQCGIVGALAQPGTWTEVCEYNCFQQICVKPAGSADKLVESIERFSEEVATVTQDDQPKVLADHSNASLSKAEIVDRIDDDRPIITGINPSGRPAGVGPSDHVALIIGYEDDGDTLIVNDPAPFSLISWSNPYVAAGGQIIDDGQYRIGYSQFVQGLNWGETIDVEHDGSVSPGSLPRYCCVGFNKVGPVPNPPVGSSLGVRAGRQCAVPNFYNQLVPGRACH